jgi:hypothetical protein
MVRSPRQADIAVGVTVKLLKSRCGRSPLLLRARLGCHGEAVEVEVWLLTAACQADMALGGHGEAVDVEVRLLTAACQADMALGGHGEAVEVHICLLTRSRLW